MTLQESNLSRLYSHMENHDCGMVTAYRSEYTHKENQQRNKKLLASLLSWGYNVTSVEGTYVEDFGTPYAKEVGEHTFFVVDGKDKGNLEKDLRTLGEAFDQDSILFIPKGGSESYLWGTNDAEFPGYNKVEFFPHRGLGKFGQFMTKKGNKPFIFESILKEHRTPNGMLGKMGTNAVSKKDWKNINL